MSEPNPSGKFWALVTLSAAVLSSPLWVHLTQRGEERPNPIEVVVKMPLQEEPKRQQPSLPSAATPLFNPQTAAQPAPAPPPPASPAGSTLPSSDRYVSSAELEGYSNWQLTIARNEIYARHGRRFRRADVQRYFDAQPWYRPQFGPDEFSDDWLNPVEKYNANLIADFQVRKYGRTE